MPGEPNLKQMRIDMPRRQPGEFVEVPVGDARCTIIYGRHDQPQEYPPLEGFNALVLEGIGDRRSMEPERFQRLDSVQYQALVEEAKRLNKPLFLPDINSFDDIERRRILDAILGQGAIMVPLVTAAVTRDMPKMTRRGFLAGSAAIAVAGGSRWRGPIEQGLDSLLGNASIADRVILNLRNDVLAQKLHTISQLVGDTGFVMGAAHSGLERSISSTDRERVQNINSILADIAKKSGRDIAEKIISQIHLITRLDWDEEENAWRLTLIEDPVLTNLSSSV
jgi:hypothetical protein